MAHKTEWLTFYIVLKDPKALKTQQTAHPYGVMIAPLEAATLYAAPWKGYDDPNTGAPYSWTPWSGLNTKGGVFPLDVSEFTRKSGGFWIFGGTTTKYIWLGKFVLVADKNRPDQGSQGPISIRRWIEGFELGSMAPYGSGLAGLSHLRDAARHVGGLGLAFRGASSAALTISLGQYGYDPAAVVGGLVNGAHTWERFYYRLRRRPTTMTAAVWNTTGFPTGSAAIFLVVTPTGDMTVFGNAPGSSTLLGTAFHMTEWDPVTNPNAWHRVDLVFSYGTPSAASAKLTIYHDGFPVLQVPSNCPGLSQASRHASSTFGSTASQPNDLEIDFDDWTCQDIPYTIDGAGNRSEVLTSLDWLNGRKIVAIHPNGYSSDHNAAGWPGDFRTLIQIPYSTASNMASLSSTTSGALAAVTTDDADVVDNDKGKIGVGAIAVWMFGTRGTTSGTVGLKANGVTTMAAVTQSITAAAQGMLKNPPGNLSTFEDYTPIELRHAKGADVSAATLGSLMAQVELVGVWGKEDVAYPNTADDQAALDAMTFPHPLGQHNAQYPHSPWALDAGAAPIAPFIVKAGTYVGNGTGFDLAFRAPVNWLFIRRTTGGAGVFMWWSTMYSGHADDQEGIRPRLPIGLEDLGFAGSTNEQQQQSYILRITGADAQINVLAATYEYLAICDPGMRFMLNLSAYHRSADGTVDNKLINPAFTPDFGFGFLESYGGTTTNRMYGKGPQSAVDVVSGFGTAAFSLGWEFAAGLLRTKATWHGLGLYGAFSLWRKSDGNSDVTGAAAVQIIGWTGDGSATRTIGLTPTGLRPLFVMVFAENTASYFRDPTHTGTNSGNPTGTDTANGITAGAIDGFTVGSALNTNAIVFNAIVFMGSATAGNNGWSINGEFANVDYESPGNSPWPNAPAEDDPSLDPGGIVDTTVDDLPFVADQPDLDNVIDLPGTDFFCVEFTRRVVNQALARLGVSKQVVDLRVDTTIEAINARLVIKDTVEQVLRDFPWPFATRYIRPPVVSGSAASPVNADWIYTYRRPWDCMFERRIVVDRGTSADPTPPPFALGSDTGGGLIYCNVANMRLEYTSRVTCPTYEGDVLFREALICKVTHKLAPALSRIEGKAQEAEQAYQLALLRARAVLAPGKPGATVASAIPLDTTTAQIAANVSVVNRALVRIGARTISSFAEQSREAQAALVIFEEELRSTLRDFPWAFATAYASPLALVAGTTTVGANDDWTYSYRLPTDLVYARRLVTSDKRAYSATPPPYKIATDATGELLYTDQASAALEYTTRQPGTVASADPLFRDAFAWRLAASLAPSLVEADPEVPEQFGRGPDDPTQPKERRATRTQLRRQAADRAWQMYQFALVKARVAAANEQQHDLNGPDAPWISGR